MTHTYKITGMTCSGCQAKVQNQLSKTAGVKNVTIDLPKGEAMIEMDKTIATSTLQGALKEYPKYQLSEIVSPVHFADAIESPKSWFATYKPLLLIFGYITAISLSIEFINGNFNLMRWMTFFMAGFFLAFSFFKFLNLQGFADSYSMYDIIAKKWKSWGFIYAFIELALGIAFLTGFNPVVTNAVTFGVMSLSIIGVIQSVYYSRKIKCACLGDVFNLPMTTVTIIEDALMIAMSGIMILLMLK